MPKNKFPCPACGVIGLGTKGKYEICAKCGWEDDPAQSRDPKLSGGANVDSVAAFKKKISSKKVKKKK